MDDHNATSPLQLVKRLQARASKDQVRSDHPLRACARELEAAIPLYFGSPQKMAAAAFIRLYSRACKAWRDHTGEHVL